MPRSKLEDLARIFEDVRPIKMQPIEQFLIGQSTYVAFSEITILMNKTAGFASFMIVIKVNFV